MRPITCSAIARKARSFKTKNSVTGSPSLIFQTPGVVNKKLRVVRNITRLKYPAIFQILLFQKETIKRMPVTISNTPIRLETI